MYLIIFTVTSKIVGEGMEAFPGTREYKFPYLEDTSATMFSQDLI